MNRGPRILDMLRRLHEISSGATSFEQKIEALLEMGCRHFGLPVGVLSHIDGDRYEVRQVASPDGSVARGAVFPLGKTACSETLRIGGPLHFHDIAESRLRTHPCCEERAFAAYAGIPVTVGDRVYGTLSFSGPNRRAPFSSTDDELLVLMAQSAGGALWQQQTDEALRDTERQFHQAQKLEAVSRLASDVAHDYNNLLMGIGGCIDIALEAMRVDDPSRVYLEEAKRASKRGATLTRALDARDTATAELRRDLGDGPAAKRRAEPEVASTANGPTILVVEDNGAARMAIGDYLAELGYRVFATGLPSEALALTENQACPVQILLTDYSLPEMKGDQLAREVRERSPEVAVIYMSGYDQLPLDPGELRIKKPIDLDELVKQLKGALPVHRSSM